MKKILVISSSASLRGLMAAGWVRYYGGSDVELTLAGKTLLQPHPEASRVMSDAVIDLSGIPTCQVDSLRNDSFDVCLQILDAGEEAVNLPDIETLVARELIIRQGEDQGDASNSQVNYENLRDEIEDICFDFVNEHVRQLIPDDLIDHANFVF